MKKLLIVVDYQQDFVTGILPVPEAITLKNNIQTLINDKSYTNIIYTFDTHTKEEYKTSEEKEFFPDIHCEYKTKGWKLFEIKPRNNIEYQVTLNNFNTPNDIFINDEMFFVKNKFDIWSGNKNYKNIFINNFDKNIEIHIVGVALNYCIYQNVMGLIKNGYKVKIIENAVKGIQRLPNGNPDISFYNTLKKMKENGVEII